MDGRLGRSIANCKIGRIVPIVGLWRRIVKASLEMIDIEMFDKLQDVSVTARNLEKLPPFGIFLSVYSCA